MPITDPAQGLVDYINQIKPYHTKIIETEVEYRSDDIINTLFVEEATIEHIDIIIAEVISNNTLKIYGTDGFNMIGGQSFQITNSTGNNGTYTVQTVLVTGDPVYTIITVTQSFSTFPLINDGFINYTVSVA